MHRSRVRAWQALAVLSRFAAGDSLPDTFRTIWSSLQVIFLALKEVTRNSCKMMSPVLSHSLMCCNPAHEDELWMA